MAENNSYVRIGNRVFNGEKELESFLSNYGGSKNFVPYQGEKIIVLDVDSENKPTGTGYYYIGDGTTPIANLSKSQSLAIGSTNAAEKGPDRIEGLADLKNTVTILEGRIAVLESQMDTAEKNIGDLNNQAILKNNIPNGLVLSFTEDVEESTIIQAFGGTGWDHVEGYLRGIDPDKEEETELLGYVSGTQYVDITTIPSHTHDASVTLNGTTTAVEVEYTGANGEEVSSTAYSPNTYYVRAFARDVEITYPEEPEDTPPSDSDDDITETEDKIIIYQAHIDKSAGDGHWLGEIQDYNTNDSTYGYAGVLGKPITGFRIGQKPEKGISLTYRIKPTNSNTWSPEITSTPIETPASSEESQEQTSTTTPTEDGSASAGVSAPEAETTWSDYVGDLQTPIGCFMIKSNDPKYRVVYQGHDMVSGKWLKVIEGYDTTNSSIGYAGFKNYKLDAIAIKIVPIPQEDQETEEDDTDTDQTPSTTPKALGISSIQIKTVEIENIPYSGAKIGDTYIEIVSNAQNIPIYLPVATPTTQTNEDK